MLFGNGKPRPQAARRRGAFRPVGEDLERRAVPAAIDLANIAGTTAGLGPFGVELSGTTPRSGVGFSVADVGDVNGDGFDDFVVGAPNVAPRTLGGQTAFTLGNGANSQAFLVFGSNDATTGQTSDWLNLTPQQRVGDLATLGNASQSNPLNPGGGPGFNFNGLTLSTGSSPSSLLGASVAALGDLTGNGFDDFLIGAPNGVDATGQPTNAGRAYLFYGGPNLATRANKLVDLDNASANTDLNVVTFVNSVPGARTGFAVSGAGNFFADGLPAVAIGAPGASVAGLSNNGAVYVVPNAGGLLSPPHTETINLSQIGQPGGLGGVVFSGARAGEAAGFSLADAGSVDGARIGGIPVDDLVIGAPAINLALQPTTAVSSGPGTAYLVYGSGNLPNLATSTGNLATINLSRLGSSTSSVAGASFVGAANGDVTGFAVSTAGDFNGDGLADFLIGSPGFSNFTGRATLIEGNRNSTGGPGRIVGTFTLSGLPSTIRGINFVGTGPGDLTGWSVSAVRRITTSALNPILIGAPGTLNSSGAVYLIPGNAGLRGTQPLANAEQAPVQATVITNSFQPPGSNPSFNFLGASVSGRLFLNRQNQSTDSDPIGDFVIGSPGLTLSPARQVAGSVFLLEGAFVPLAIPTTNGFPIQIGVGAPAGQATYTLPTASPTTLQIGVNGIAASGTTPAFNPSTDIDPASLVINGVSIPAANVTIAADPTNAANAIISIDTAGLGLVPFPGGTSTFTISGLTTATAPNPNSPFVGSTTIIVPGGVVGGGGGTSVPPSVPISNTFGFPLTNPAGPVLGERLVPQPQTLSQIRWKPLSYPVAFRQFRPSPQYQTRHQQIFDPDLTIKHGHFAQRHDQFMTRSHLRRDRPLPVIHHHAGLTIPPTV